MRLVSHIRFEAKRLISRHERHGRLVSEENARRSSRSTHPELTSLKRPEHWALDSGFDPYVTRSRASKIAYGIEAALAAGEYAPRRPHRYKVPKPDGGERDVCIYQVADGAVSKMLLDALHLKNLPIMSARSYAYRPDRSAQNAIQYLKLELVGRKRVFVAEYDFRKYFDTIDHDYLRRILGQHFFASDSEIKAIEGFLRTAPSIGRPYQAAGGSAPDRGIPQGTSISLFLANVAAWELDLGMERLGVGFVRYADDTLLWSTDYGRLCAAADLIHSHAEIIGVAVNAEKSPGIRLLVPSKFEAEMASTERVDYLGHALGASNVALKKSAEDKMKRRIDRLIFGSLLREPLRSAQAPERVSGAVDRDYLSLVVRLRRYLYGDLSESDLRAFQLGDAPMRRFKGAMAGFPLVDDRSALAALDSWILDRVWLATRKRTALLSAQGWESLPPPHNLGRDEMAHLRVYDASAGRLLDLTLPSASRIADTIGRAAGRHGPARVGQPAVYG